MPKKMNVGGLSNELESSAFFIRRNTKKDILNATSENDVTTSKKSNNKILDVSKESKVETKQNLILDATSQSDITTSNTENQTKSNSTTTDTEENHSARTTSSTDVATSPIVDKIISKTSPRTELEKSENINSKATSNNDVAASSKTIVSSANNSEVQEEDLIFEKSKFTRDARLKSRENSTINVTSRSDVAISQEENQPTKTKSKKVIEEEKLKAVIEMILEIGTVPFTTPVRMSVEEKREIEDYVTIKLRKKGIPKTKISISKIMRICTLYMMKVHEEELTNVLTKTIKNRGILKL